MSFTYTYTLTDGTTASAAQVQQNFNDAKTAIDSNSSAITGVQALVPSQPLLSSMTSTLKIYGVFTADFTAGIGPGSTITKVVDVSGSIGSKTPVIVLGQTRNGAGSGMAQVSWRAERSAGTVTLAVYNDSASGTQYGYLDFVVIA